MDKKTIKVLVFKNEKTKDTQPDYRVKAKLGGEFIDCGAGWVKDSKSGSKYISITLDTDILEKLYKEKYDKVNSDGSDQPIF